MKINQVSRRLLFLSLVISLLHSPPDQCQLACRLLRLDRPAQDQRLGRYLTERRWQLAPEMLDFAESAPPQRALHVLSLLGSGESFEDGRLYLGDECPLSEEQKERARRLYLHKRFELGPANRWWWQQYDSDLELLARAEAQPNSKFTQACREYAQIRGGTYFGDEYYWSHIRGPESPSTHPRGTVEQWQAWLERYPDHPGADDALYWKGRCLEWQGERVEALHLFLGKVPGDGDMGWRFSDHLLWLLDIGTTEDDLTEFVRRYPAHPARDLVVYAQALRLARHDAYREALELTRDLNLTRAWRPYAADVYNDWDFSLAQPDVPNSRLHRLPPNMDEELQTQRAMWRRCAWSSRRGLVRQWSQAGGWRLGYLVLHRGSRAFRWAYTWDAYLSDIHRPDGQLLQAEARRANQNEHLLELCQGDDQRARYNRLSACYSQWTSASFNETTFLGRDYVGRARDEARAILRDQPGSSLADDVFLTLGEMSEREDLREFLRVHFPNGDRTI
ncbi:MAG: hypothetical protein KC910_01195 [Candidatus Eremiobacteraeota bacterium]|nr:hypothetical protein [Candidatus Eremiobacteraeota bacterium]